MPHFPQATYWVFTFCSPGLQDPESLHPPTFVQPLQPFHAQVLLQVWVCCCVWDPQFPQATLWLFTFCWLGVHTPCPEQLPEFSQSLQSSHWQEAPQVRLRVCV